MWSIGQEAISRFSKRMKKQIYLFFSWNGSFSQNFDIFIDDISNTTVFVAKIVFSSIKNFWEKLVIFSEQNA